MKTKKNNIKGVILAGGHASRLYPLTLVTNKHLLPIYDRPMIYYPLQSMKEAGIKEVLIITNPQHAGDFLNLLGTGEGFGLKLHFAIQKNPGGLAEAVSLTRSFSNNDPFVVILGDNLFDFSLKPAIARFIKQEKGGRIFTMAHPQPQNYGVVEINSNNKIISIEEKPKKPKSNLIQIGIYMYYPSIFNYIEKLNPSNRGELEITDLNNIIRERGELYCEKLEENNWWIDAGTSYNELLTANIVAAKRNNKNKQAL